jgi:predicted transcriptional regulator
MIERRAKVAILKDILSTIQKKDGKAKPTHILYGANLSHDRLKKYLDSLIIQGFVEKTEENGQTFYVITQRGREFISGFNKMKNFLDAFGVRM